MTSVAFDGFDQVGDEVGAALVLVDDFRPGGIHALIGTLQAVVEGDAIAAEKDDEGGEDEGQAFHKGSGSGVGQSVTSAAAKKKRGGAGRTIKGGWPAGPLLLY